MHSPLAGIIPKSALSRSLKTASKYLKLLKIDLYEKFKHKQYGEICAKHIFCVKVTVCFRQFDFRIIGLARSKEYSIWAPISLLQWKMYEKTGGEFPRGYASQNVKYRRHIFGSATEFHGRSTLTLAGGKLAFGRISLPQHSNGTSLNHDKVLLFVCLLTPSVMTRNNT